MPFESRPIGDLLTWLPDHIRSIGIGCLAENGWPPIRTRGTGWPDRVPGSRRASGDPRPSTMDQVHRRDGRRRVWKGHDWQCGRRLTRGPPARTPPGPSARARSSLNGAGMIVRKCRRLPRRASPSARRRPRRRTKGPLNLSVPASRGILRVIRPKCELARPGTTVSATRPGRIYLLGKERSTGLLATRRGSRDLTPSVGQTSSASFRPAGRNRCHRGRRRRNQAGWC